MKAWLRALLIGFVTLGSLAAALVYPIVARGYDWTESTTWRRPWAFALLALVPFALWWGTFGQDKRRPRVQIGTIIPLATGPRGFRTYVSDAPGAVRAAALVFLTLALAQPQNMLRDQNAEEKGIDIMLVLDLSGSMRAVLDADPHDLPGKPAIPQGRRLTRLDTAKIVVQDFISRRKTDRIGVVVFGTSAFILSPPTLDYRLLDTLVGQMNLNTIDGNGTAIGDAVGTAVARMRRSDARSKVILLLTDGDSNAGEVSPEKATELAASFHCKIYPIQIGNDDEVDVEDGDLLGQPRYSRRRFPVNPDLLKKMAAQTGGEAFVATDGKALAASMHQVLDQLEKTRFEASIASYEELFPFLLFPGAALIALDALLRAFLLRRFP
jgi:Ca-activated chloride channel family protein